MTFMILTLSSSHATKHEDRYAHHQLSLIASNYAPSIGKPVVFKAKITPTIDESEIKYQFIINGEPIAEPGMHKVHIFRKKGTYKVSVVATLDGTHLINSPAQLIRVSEAWKLPVADITPKMLTLKTGETAIFESTSETDPNSRQWLYWSISSGHRSNGTRFKINTSRLKEGTYAISLLLRDDRKNESKGQATLIIDNNPSTPSSSSSSNDQRGYETTEQNRILQEQEQNETTHTSSTTKTHYNPVTLTFHASHIHRFTGMPIVFWVQNAQIGADTQLQLDTGDDNVSTWTKRLRYSHVYKNFGRYQVTLSARPKTNPTDTSLQQHHTLTVYIWPLWLPLLLIGSVVLLAMVMLFKRRKNTPKKPQTGSTKKDKKSSIISYKHYPDEGYQQITITEESEKKPASFSLGTQPDAGTQTLKTPKGE